jgi:hypothetical protein
MALDRGGSGRIGRGFSILNDFPTGAPGRPPTARALAFPYLDCEDWMPPIGGNTKL